MKALAPLRAELDLWGEAGSVASLWWRDDDAAEDDAPLRRMLDLSEAGGAPVFIAVVPALATAALAAAIQGCDGAIPVQHGWAHTNHAPPDAKNKWELGQHRPRETVLAELQRGHARMTALFGDEFRPMLVPPWNRIDPALYPQLPGLGFAALSTFGPQAATVAAAAAAPAPGVAQFNTHCDIIAWKRERAFIGAEKTAQRLAEHLQLRRRGEVADEPTGLLTHVWAQDEETWGALADVLALVAAHPAGRWLDWPTLLASTDGGAESGA